LVDECDWNHRGISRLCELTPSPPYLSLCIANLLPLQAALNLVAFILVFLFCPETKGRTLEELQFTFDLSTRKHVRYRVGYVGRYFVDKYIKFRNPPAPIPFYRWARITYEE